MNPKTTLKLEVFSGFHAQSADFGFLSALRTAWTQMASTAAIKLNLSLYSIYDVFQPSLTDQIEPRVADFASSTQPSQVATIYLGFSAGCIRAAWSANLKQVQKQHVTGIIAIDGWGIPLMNPMISTARLSHDCFTHLSSERLGGRGLFFADPPVPHLFLWEYLDQVNGWYYPTPEAAMEINAAIALVRSMLCLIQGSVMSR